MKGGGANQQAPTPQGPPSQKWLPKSVVPPDAHTRARHHHRASKPPAHIQAVGLPRQDAHLLNGIPDLNPSHVQELLFRGSVSHHGYHAPGCYHASLLPHFSADTTEFQTC